MNKEEWGAKINAEQIYQKMKEKGAVIICTLPAVKEDISKLVSFIVVLSHWN